MTRKSDDTRTLLFTGSFDPFTIGHLSIVERGLKLADRVVIGIGINENKLGDLSPDDRQRRIEAIFRNRPEVSVIQFSGLAVDAARSCGATAFLRGVRSTTDFEFERNMADVNRRIAGIDTVLLFAEPDLACVSSSVVRELAHNGFDTSKFLPAQQ